MVDTLEQICSTRPLSGKVSLITGASRGIGREIALTLAKAGSNVIIAAKSVKEQPNLPGTIHTVASEARAYNVIALPIQCDVRSESAIQNMITTAEKKFGKNCIDILICNSGALWWKDVIDTPMTKYDLVNEVNSRATFSCIQKVLPHMKSKKYGRIIVMSPPIDMRLVDGKVAYCISKFGMSLIAIGLAKEVERFKGDVSINALWPATLIESFATKNFRIGEKAEWRKAEIIGECVIRIVLDDSKIVNGCLLIDEDYLKSKGIEDFKKYRVVPDIEPTKNWPPIGNNWLPKNTNGLPPGISSSKL